jgi:hypothetical protein
MSTGQPRKIGKFEILAEIGQGSMGTVYKARDPGLDRVIALKTILPGSVIETEARERFLREARSVARLQHPNIITIFELGQMEDVPYIAMEFLEGESLSDAVKVGRPTKMRRKLEVIRQLCRGLGYAHERGVVHRDVKPSNIFLLPDGTAKILDFGVAWLEGGTFATRTGMLVGTPAYMAPEQFSGEKVDHRVDMWSLGVILYEMIAGGRPFTGDTVPQLIYRIVHTSLPELDSAELGVPGGVVHVIERALEKVPDSRFPDLGAMANALRDLIDGGEAADVDATVSLGPSPEVPREPPTEPVGEAADTAMAPTPAFDATVARFHAGVFHDQGMLAEAGPLSVIAVSPDERLLAIGGVDGSVRLWNLESKVAVRTLRSRIHLKTGHAALTTSLAFSPDGVLLATGHLDGAIYVWDSKSGFEMDAKLRHEGAVGGLAFTPDGSTLISGGQDATLKFWGVESIIAGDARRQMRRQPADVTELALSPKGDLVVTGHGNLNLRAHDTESGRLVATFHGLRSVPSALALSPDAGILACGTRNGNIRLFRLAGRAELRRYEAHAKTVSSLAFFPDGRHIASVAMDRELAIWEVSHEDRMATLTASADATCASVQVLGRTGKLVCGLADGQVRCWSFGDSTPA